jgi:hypothetical protein
MFESCTCMSGLKYIYTNIFSKIPSTKLICKHSFTTCSFILSLLLQRNGNQASLIQVITATWICLVCYLIYYYLYLSKLTFTWKALLEFFCFYFQRLQQLVINSNTGTHSYNLELRRPESFEKWRWRHAYKRRKLLIYVQAHFPKKQIAVLQLYEVF